ncbi:Cleft lip and palate transmembrane protein 1 (CLPTM1) domain containing protein [Nitzschia inconspicua]|uniref:Cleft lip and palate transmembrane protein 1 (CLPTM1) domain containing protein n=1 Tax=Nitzschia inconspicua TaxID=303405 RepID=A0A9K3L6M6_9STRA|nr:Cleft lip and palate transmembrane protein 1 (CLPTM1) domain containing protein [Nitzschia inconspicua]
MWYFWILLLLSYFALTWRSLKEAASPLVPCQISSSFVNSEIQQQQQQPCFRPTIVVGDSIVFQLELFQPVSTITTTTTTTTQNPNIQPPFRWISIDSCRLNATIPPTGKLPELLTRNTALSNNTTSIVNPETTITTTTTISTTNSEPGMTNNDEGQTCLVTLPEFARVRSSQQTLVHPLMARFVVFQQTTTHNINDGSVGSYKEGKQKLVGLMDPFYLTRINKRTPNDSGLASLVWNSNEKASSSQSEEDISNHGSNDNYPPTSMWVPFLKYGKNTPVRIRFVAENRGYAMLQRADGVALHPLNATSYSPILYVDELSLQHSSQVELAPPEGNKPPITLHVKFGSISPEMDAVNRQVHTAFDTVESFLSGPELDEIRYFLKDEKLYRFALTQIISYLHMWFDYLAFRDEIRFYRGRQNLSGVSSTTVLTRLGCSIVIFLYLLDGGGTSWVVLLSVFSSCAMEAWKVWKLLKPTLTTKFPFVAVRELQSTKDRETAEYDRIACRYLAMVLYPMVAVWSLYALKQYEYASWYSWFISNMANAVYTFGFISLCPQLYINYRLKSVAHLPWKVFMYKIFTTFVDDAFAWLIEMPLKHRLMTLRDDVVFIVFLVQVYIYRVDKTRTNEFGYSYEEKKQDGELENEKNDEGDNKRIIIMDNDTPPLSVSKEPKEKVRSAHIIVIVLGDLGRSPRMQYHANSLLQAGHSVSLIGYVGEDLIPSLQNMEKESSGQLNVIRFSVPTPAFLRKILPLYLIWRISSLCLSLLYILVVTVPKATSGTSRKNVDCVLVQNPPAMPLLAIIYVYCHFIARYLQGYTPGFIIDWHNLGFTMLSSNLFSKIARFYEESMAPRATAHFCVTEAMGKFINQQFFVPNEGISILHDCSNSMFRPQTLEDNHKMMKRLHEQLCSACPKSWYQNLDPERQTLFTEQSNKDSKVFLPRRNRPALVTSSTSWTPDEDFGQLLDALVGLDETITQQDLFLKVLVVVTGKGPQKQHFLEKISKLKLMNVAIQTLWLEPGDYPRLLACADVAVSLHTSTSGIDLPMKILDSFGCEVPVCARGFRCLPELVQDDVNGRVFDSSQELQEQLLRLLKPLATSDGPWPPHSFGDLARYSRCLQGRRRWDENWNEKALPLIQTVVNAATPVQCFDNKIH